MSYLKLLFLAASAAAVTYGQNANLVGSWAIRVTIPAGSSACPAGGSACVFPALGAFARGGISIQTAPLPGTSTGHGVCKRTGPRAYTIRSTYFRSDAQGNVLGTAVTVTNVELSARRKDRRRNLFQCGHRSGRPDS